MAQRGIALEQRFFCARINFVPFGDYDCQSSFLLGHKWFERRKIITPTFHFKILEQFVEVFDKLGDTVVTSVLGRFEPGAEIEMYQIMVLYALDVMCGEKIFPFRQF